MRWTVLLRLLPAAVVVGGFFLTLRIAADRADLFAQERSAARHETYQGFADISDHEVDRLRAEAARVDGLIQTLFLTSGDEEQIRDTLDSLQVFERGPLIRAVEYNNAGDRRLILPDGLQPIHPLPAIIKHNRQNRGQLMVTGQLLSTDQILIQ